MNDEMECLLGKEVLRDAFEEEAQRLSWNAATRRKPPAGAKAWRLAGARYYLDGPLERSDFAIGTHLSSWSEERDLLSQWRAYGGYAIGLPFETLAALAQEQGFEMYPCMYRKGLQEGAAKDIRNSLLDYYKDARRHEQRHPSLDTLATPTTMATHAIDGGPPFFGKVFPLFKHEGFSEEREWRIVGQVFSHNQSKTEGLHLKAVRGRVSRYLELRLTDASGTVPGITKDRKLEIVLGPGNNRDADEDVIRSLMAREAGNGRLKLSADGGEWFKKLYAIEKSSTPYRQA